MSQGEPDFGEQILNKVAEVGITSQLQQVEQLNVDIRTDPLKLMQGKVDSVTVSGEGMVVRHDLRMESLEVSADNVVVNAASIVFGKIELSEPANAEAQICLTESDINQALQSNFLHSKLLGLEVKVKDEIVVFDVQYAKMYLLEDGNININAGILFRNTAEEKQFSATVRPKVEDSGYRIALEVLSVEAEGLALDFVGAVVAQLVELSDLRRSSPNGISLRLKDVEVQKGKLTLRTETQIEQIPSI